MNARFIFMRYIIVYILCVCVGQRNPELYAQFTIDKEKRQKIGKNNHLKDKSVQDPCLKDENNLFFLQHAQKLKNKPNKYQKNNDKM